MRNIHEKTRNDKSSLAFLIFLIVATIGLAMLSGFKPYKPFNDVLVEDHSSSGLETNLLLTRPYSSSPVGYHLQPRACKISFKHVAATSAMVAAAPVIGVNALFSYSGLAFTIIGILVIAYTGTGFGRIKRYLHAANTLGTGPVRNCNTNLSSLAGSVILTSAGRLKAISIAYNNTLFDLMPHQYLPPWKRQSGPVFREPLLFPHEREARS